jgi:glycosyltransferase involved in cell wall biosynthesis
MREEAWPSMDLVADMLVAHLQHPPRAVAPRLVRPHLVDVPFRTGRPTTRVRVLNRFWLYRRALVGLGADSDVFHILDHSYAHLALDLRPERTVITCHDVDAFTDAPGDGGLPGFLQSRLVQGMRRAAVVTCDSRVTRDALLDLSLVPGERTVVVPNGVDECALPDQTLREHADRLLGPSCGIEMLHVGSTIPRKRVDVLLRVFAAVRAERPDVRLIRVGGPFTPDQQALADRLGVSGGLVVMPPLARDELHALYRRAAIVISTSEREGFGLPVAEALAAGTPVVISDIPIFREVAGDVAEFVPLEDVDAWKRAVLGLIDEREREVERWRQRQSRTRARGREFSWATYASRMAEVYREIVGDRAAVRESAVTGRPPVSAGSPPSTPAVGVISLIAATLRGRTAQWATAEVVAAGGVDTIVTAAREQGVNALLWQVDRATSVLDADVRAALAADARVEVTREMLRHAELGALTQALAAAGCRALFFKGSALAYSHYPEPWLRPRVDTDVLVSRDEMNAVGAVLRARGYTEADALSTGELVSHQAAWERRDGMLHHVIDVHWRIANPQLFAHALSLEDLWSDSRLLPTLDPAARGPSNVHAFVLAAVHRLAHHQNHERLVWLYDLHLLASAFSRNDWAALVRAARAARLTAVCRDALIRAGDTFDTVLPADVLDCLALSDLEPTRVYVTARQDRIDVLRSDLGALAWRDRLRLLREHLFPPVAFMLHRYRIRRRSLLPALYAHRLVSGAYRWLTRTA